MVSYITNDLNTNDKVFVGTYGEPSKFMNPSAYNALK